MSKEAVGQMNTKIGSSEYWSKKGQHVPDSKRQKDFINKSGITGTFSGLVYCADCGEKLCYGATDNGKREGAFFDCSLRWKHKDKCGTHFIRESVLE